MSLVKANPWSRASQTKAKVVRTADEQTLRKRERPAMTATPVITTAGLAGLGFGAETGEVGGWRDRSESNSEGTCIVC